MKEQIIQAQHLQNFQTSSRLTKQPKTTRHIAKNQKQSKKKRQPFSRKIKTLTKSESLLTSETKSPNMIQNTHQTTSPTLPSPLNIFFQGFIFKPISLQQQTHSNLAQINEYLGSIGQYYFQRQTRFPLPPLKYSIHFGPKQRLRLIDLIIQHCSRLKLTIQTQFLALDIFHRICTHPVFERYHSSLKAASALYVASKYHQLCPPQSHSFTTIDSNQRILSQNIVKLQGLIMIHLNFNLSYSVPLNFAQLLSVRFQLNIQARHSLISLCKKAIYRQDIWLGKASLIAMASFCCLFGRVKEWQQIDELRWELDWRMTILQQLLDK